MRKETISTFQFMHQASKTSKR